VYPLRPDELAEALATFVTRVRPVRLVGGCCGTTPEHVRAVVEAVSSSSRRNGGPSTEPGGVVGLPVGAVQAGRLDPQRRGAHQRQRLQGVPRGDAGRPWDDCVEIAKAQTREGAHMLDLCVDYVGRDGTTDMAELASGWPPPPRCRSWWTPPSPRWCGPVWNTRRAVRDQLGQLRGRHRPGLPVPARIMELAVEHGAAVVVTCIDEEGQARTAEWKVRVAERAIEDLTTNWGLDPSRHHHRLPDLPDRHRPGGGPEGRPGDHRGDPPAQAASPGRQTTLGLSNVSFGLNPAARQVLNSVFLNECVNAGLDSAIVNASKILPMNKIPDEQRRSRSTWSTTAVGTATTRCSGFMQLFEGKTASSARLAGRGAGEAAAVGAVGAAHHRRRAQRPGGGPRRGDAGEEALGDHQRRPARRDEGGRRPVRLGQMQLPFVLQSAEVMKAAVAYLEPHMEKVDADGKGKHRAGHGQGRRARHRQEPGRHHPVQQRLRGVNLGIKQPVNAILEAAEEHQVDAIGMSGLLVKSTVVMKENLEEMNARGVADAYPVLLGGAALTRAYVEHDLDEIYEGEVRYAKDAFEGLKLMDRIMAVKRGETPEEDAAEEAKKAERKARRERSLRIAEKRRAEQGPEPDLYDTTRSDVDPDVPVPVPPFWGAKVVKGVAVADYLSLLDERATFFGQWGLRGARKGEGPSYEELVESEGRPRLRAWIDELSTQGILAHAALVYGYFPCYSEGNDLVVLEKDEPDALERLRFTFPRQRRDRRLCLADFFRSKEKAEQTGQVDVLPMQLVTMGQPIADYANELFARNAYRDYLEVHGLGVQLTEALAEYWHRRIRQELRFPSGAPVAAEDPEDVQQFFRLGYRGARFSFGYGACPDLEDRAKIVELLDAGRIGVTLSEEFQLHPEQSTDAIVAHHPEAKYFSWRNTRCPA
jgi:5-methyltetrahydrofolate--homocysteine methyltransferase